MRLWLDVAPASLLSEPPEALAERAWRELATWAGREELPVYTSDGLAVRVRLISELASPAPDTGFPGTPPGPAISTAAWYLVHVLEGLLWREAGQVGELHVRREWGRLAGVEVSL
jgi:hypothetical protein